MKKIAGVFFLGALLSGCEASVNGSSDVTGPLVEYYPMPSDPEGVFPFSQAVRVGNLLFLSGAIGIVPGESQLVPGGIQPETRQTMENIKVTLERHGSSLDKVVKCTVFLADISEWGQMNEVYREYFPDHKPARSALGASGLALGARTEIECIATL